MFIGMLLVLMGVLMFLEKMGIIYGSSWDYFVPAAIIALGLSMIFERRRKRLKGE